MIVQNNDTQLINIFIDDSGVFTIDPNTPYFVYGGYVLIGVEQRESANREYRTLSDKIHQEIGHKGELKATHLAGTKHKRALVKVLKGYESFACTIEVPKLRSFIHRNKLSVHRYKDYALKIALKRKLETLINSGKVNASASTILNIYIDEQHTSTDGYYTLEESIREEFLNGIKNSDYGSFHPPLFTGTVAITVKFCDSSQNYLIQASDILANRIHTSFNYNLPDLRQLPKLHIVKLP